MKMGRALGGIWAASSETLSMMSSSLLVDSSGAFSSNCNLSGEEPVGNQGYRIAHRVSDLSSVGDELDGKSLQRSLGL